MASSQDYMQQIEQMGSLPDYRSVIAEAYDKPVLRGVVNNIANVESQYLPSMFDTFAQMGTGAADMSPAAKLSMIGGNLGRLTSQANAGANVLGYYDATIGRLADRASTDWQQRQQRLMFLAQMAQQREEAEKARAAAAAQAASSTQGLRDLMAQQQAAAANAAKIKVNPVQAQAAGGRDPNAFSSQVATRVYDAWMNPGALTDNTAQQWLNRALSIPAAPVGLLGYATGWF